MEFSQADFLNWVRGPVFGWALGIFLFGVLLRLLEILTIGRKKDLSEPREHKNGSGWRTILTRTLPDKSTFRANPFTYVTGYIFHIGFFIVLFFYVPHIELFRSLLGIGWPGLPTPVIDATAVVTIITLVLVYVNRLTNPVKKLLTNLGDHVAWWMTLLPVLTGWMAYHHFLLPYQTMLAIHILSVEVLLVILPFTKLSHSFSLFISRWQNGEAFARKGVRS